MWPGSGATQIDATRTMRGLGDQLLACGALALPPGITIPLVELMVDRMFCTNFFEVTKGGASQPVSRVGESR